MSRMSEAEQLKNSQMKQRGDQVLAGTYARFPVTMVEGSGCRLRDADGREYLDFLAGIAVCSLGHCHPAVTTAIRQQAAEMVHVSNLFYMEPQVRLAELLCANSFAEKVFLCNSGAEANEAAIKMARIASAAGRYEVISLSGSFHGRTLATVAATGQSKFHQGFEPLPQGFSHVPYGDLAALEAAVSDITCAVLCEPLQGEGGVRPLEKAYLQGIRDLCDRKGLLLIFDEIQTGLCRTGSLFAYQQYGIVPDIMTLAKALANGLPLGAMLTTDKVAAAFTPGTHASTFGGNPVACAAAVASLEVMLADGFLTEMNARADYLRSSLLGLKERFPKIINSVRGMGMLLGAVLTEEMAPKGGEIVQAMFDRGFIINFAGLVALRFAPPLVVTTEEIDTMIAALSEVLSNY